MASPARAPTPLPFPTGFVVGIFLVGLVATGVVGVLGIEGKLGSGIPGTYHPSAGTAGSLARCQGKEGAGPFYFALVAEANGALSFNGSAPGPCFAVAAGAHVTVNFSVAHGARYFVSWELVAAQGPVSGSAALLPVFAGAGWSTEQRFTGLFAGQAVNFSFVASAVGEYRYVSEVDGGAAAGLWGAFNVTSAIAPAVGHSPGFAHPSLLTAFSNRWIVEGARP